LLDLVIWTVYLAPPSSYLDGRAWLGQSVRGVRGAATNVSTGSFSDGDISISTVNRTVLTLLYRVQHPHNCTFREQPDSNFVSLTVSITTGMYGPVRQYEPDKESFMEG